MCEVNADNPNISTFELDRFDVVNEDTVEGAPSYLDMGVEVYSLATAANILSFKYADIAHIKFSRANLSVEVNYQCNISR